MSNIPDNLYYTKDHEWLMWDEESSTATIGITDYAQDSLGDITFVDLPTPGQSFAEGDIFGVVESVKAASDLFMPVKAEVIEVNPDASSSPELINDVPYENGWLIRVQFETADELSKLLSPSDYQAHTEA